MKGLGARDNPCVGLRVNGAEAATVNAAHHGQRGLYACEQAGNRFGDESKTRLVNGVARVNAVS